MGESRLTASPREEQLGTRAILATSRQEEYRERVVSKDCGLGKLLCANVSYYLDTLHFVLKILDP